MKTIKLFNAVLKKDNNERPFLSENGYIIDSGALWAKKKIISYLSSVNLDAYGLNKTFHKSWSKISESTRLDLLIEQILHYVSTYVNDFQDEIYIPKEILDLPDFKLKFKFIKSYTRDELVEKCLNLLQSGIALSEETIDDILDVLDELCYKITGDEKIRNKEAIIKIADKYNIYPKDTIELFRYIIYKSTNSTLLIKDNETINIIKSSNFNPSELLMSHGLDKVAEIFNRFKPLFLAYKSKCPSVINKLSKLSKKHHKPLLSNPLNHVTYIPFNIKEDKHWLDNATPFALFKAISACFTRLNGQTDFVYRVRNGKSFVKSNNSTDVVSVNLKILLMYCKERFKLENKKFFIPKDIDYALPTSEKMFIGNIPTGTKFYGESLAVGVYWENEGGAYDIDISGINIGGKVGWNAHYNQNNDLLYSGDITSAPNGAVEYLYAKNGLKMPTLVQSNIFNGKVDSDYKIIIGRGDDINRNYMMNPENLFIECNTKSVQKQTILGILLPCSENKSCFVLLNFGAGECRVSGNNVISDKATNALFQQYNKSFSLSEMLFYCDAELVEHAIDADFDLSIDNLQKDTFIDIFK